MHSRFYSLLANIGALALIGVAFLALVYFLPNGKLQTVVSPAATTSIQVAAADIGLPESPTLPPPVPAAKPKATAAAIAQSAPQKPLKQGLDNEAVRIPNPYPFPPLSFALVNDITRASLVNILCMSQGSIVRPVSGSGVIVDPRGVILTNAHVAQYVLLSQSPEIRLSCTIRTGAPASAYVIPQVLFIPPVWVEKHAQEIRMERPLGTGEHDYALLLVSKSLDGSPFLPPAGGFPYLPVDTREGIGFQGDQVLVASYPAEFIGGYAAQFNLYPVSSITTIRQLLTFITSTVDLISLGGIVEAQSGSSGGAVVNAWGRLVGIISTTSEGETTATRDLRALTLSYINRDLTTQNQFDLPTILAGDVFVQAQDFNTRIAPRLIDLYIKELSN